MRNNVFIIIYIYLHIATNTTHAFTPLSYPDHLLHNVKSDGDVNAIDKLKCFNRNACIISLCLSLTCFLSYPNYVQAIDMMSPTTTGNDEILSWLLPNGQVQIKNPSTSFPNRKLHNPKLLGSGGGGAVFSMQQHSKNSDKKEIAVKISWINSADSVTRECNILNALEEKNARHLEHCLGIVPYPFDQRRVMIALEPVVNDATASIVSLEESKQFICVKSIVETMVDMLAANVVTTDVQLLIDKKSGEVIFIDMTEAKLISQPPSFLDLAQVSSFCSEMLALVPEKLLPIASKELEKELNSRITFIDNRLVDVIERIYASP